MARAYRRGGLCGGLFTLCWLTHLQIVLYSVAPFFPKDVRDGFSPALPHSAPLTLPRKDSERLQQHLQMRRMMPIRRLGALAFTEAEDNR